MKKFKSILKNKKVRNLVLITAPFIFITLLLIQLHDTTNKAVQYTFIGFYIAYITSYQVSMKAIVDFQEMKSDANFWYKEHTELLQKYSDQKEIINLIKKYNGIDYIDGLKIMDKLGGK